MFFSKKLNVLGVIWIIICVGVLVFSVIGMNYLERKYDGEMGLNMVMIGESRVAVITLRKESSESGFMILPENLMVKDEKNGSAYRVGSLWGLGKLEQWSLSKASARVDCVGYRWENCARSGLPRVKNIVC